MGICNKCQIEKSLDEFSLKSKALGTKQKICKECTSKQIRAHYYKNREYYIQKSGKRNRHTRERLRLHLWKYLLSHPCVDCGEKDPVVLEFDHQHSKKMHVSHMVHKPLVEVYEEIAKCVVRCANCHRRKTAEQLHWFKPELPL